MSEEQAVRVYQAAMRADESGKHPGMTLLVALLMVCGMRRSEILGLSFDAVNLDTETVTIFRTVVAGERGEPIMRDERAKSETSIRTISIPSEFVPMIQKHRTVIKQIVLAWGKGYQREPLLLFPTFGGAPLPPGVLTIRLRQLHRQAGVKGVAPTHGFRHGMASAMVASGIDIKRFPSGSVIALQASHCRLTCMRLTAEIRPLRQLGKQFSAMMAASDKP
ncbi:tyrosine-type recombinase/integrase [Rhizobium leguminosarum]|uniref:tyrosine-type recombinase/integrase n=1 Tax=Rhizobium leguminosarum TaxID=384 RepID=UPI001C955C19|nr:tyrosine-type recombinase/integrase [Rhizobium leguminosarum]MBY5350563.1 tyrosine-type recombinase/integrase [Rhizobium leguminosarum]